MKPDRATLLSRQRGTLPDLFWAQLNGKSAQENFEEQRQQIYDALLDRDCEFSSLHITSEVKIK